MLLISSCIICNGTLHKLFSNNFHKLLRKEIQVCSLYTYGIQSLGEDLVSCWGGAGVVKSRSLMLCVFSILSANKYAVALALF
jgi:hypothetical protein